MARVRVRMAAVLEMRRRTSRLASLERANGVPLVIWADSKSRASACLATHHLVSSPSRSICYQRAYRIGCTIQQSQAVLLCTSTLTFFRIKSRRYIFLLSLLPTLKYTFAVCVCAALVGGMCLVKAGLSVSTSPIFGLLCRAHPPYRCISSA